MKFIYKSTTLTVLLSFLLAARTSDAAVTNPTVPGTPPKSGDAFKVIEAGTPPTEKNVGTPSNPATPVGTPSQEVQLVHPEVLSKEQVEQHFPAAGVIEPKPQANVQPLPQGHVAGGAVGGVVTQGVGNAPAPVTTPEQTLSKPAAKVSSSKGVRVAEAHRKLGEPNPEQPVHETVAAGTEAPPTGTDIPQAPPLEPAAQHPVKAQTVPSLKPSEPPGNAPVKAGLESAAAKTGAESAPSPQGVRVRAEPSAHLHTYRTRTQHADPAVYKKVIQTALDSSFNEQIPPWVTKEDRFIRLVSWNLSNSNLGGNVPQNVSNAVDLLVRFRPSVLMLQQLPLLDKKLHEEFLTGLKVKLKLEDIIYCHDATTMSGMLIASRHPLVKENQFRYLLDEKEDDCFALRTAIELSLGKDYEPVTVNLVNVNLSPSVVSLSNQLDVLVPKLKHLSPSPLLVAGTTNKTGWTLSASLLEPVSLKSVYTALNWKQHPEMTYWNGEVVDHVYTTNPLASSLLGAYEGASLDSDHLPQIVDLDVVGTAKKKVVTTPPTGEVGALAKGVTGAGTPSTVTLKPSTTGTESAGAGTTAPKSGTKTEKTKEQAQTQKKKAHFWGGRNAATPSASNTTVLQALLICAILLLN